jgi:hypothetical protein
MLEEMLQCITKISYFGRPKLRFAILLNYSLFKCLQWFETFRLFIITFIWRFGTMPMGGSYK